MEKVSKQKSYIQPEIVGVIVLIVLIVGSALYFAG